MLNPIRSMSFSTARTTQVTPVERISHIPPESPEERRAREDAEYDHKCRMRDKWTEHNVSDDEGDMYTSDSAEHSTYY